LLHKASHVWAAIDECSGAAAEAYQAAVEDQAARNAAARRLMLTSVLEGTAGNVAAAREIMRVLHLDRHGPFWSSAPRATRSRAGLRRSASTRSGPRPAAAGSACSRCRTRPRSPPWANG
jgi:hypothetical protein